MYDMEMWLGVLKRFIEAEPIVTGVVLVMEVFTAAYIVKAILVAVTDIVTSPFKAVIAIVTAVFGTLQVILRGHPASCCSSKCCEPVKAPVSCCSAGPECCASLDVEGLVGELVTGKPAKARVSHPLEHRRATDKA